jgi:hypothetical protein
MAKVKKLYFDAAVQVNTGVARNLQLFNATAVTVGTPANDRYGNFLDTLAALTAGSPSASKTRNAVTAVFVPSNLTNGADGGTAVDAFVDFVAPLPTAVNVDTAGIADPVLSSNFRVRLRISKLAADSTVNATGVVYVQRQHSIEV